MKQYNTKRSGFEQSLEGDQTFPPKLWKPNNRWKEPSFGIGKDLGVPPRNPSPPAPTSNPDSGPK